jgi:hypothetical protein
MQYVVNGKVFNDVDEATRYEAELNKQQEENKARKEKYIAQLSSIIDSNIHIAKYVTFSGRTKYLAVCANVDQDKLKKLVYYFVEVAEGKRYDCLASSEGGVPEIVENYKFQKLSDEEITEIKSAICNYIVNTGRFKRDNTIMTDKGSVSFKNFLKSGVAPATKQTDDSQFIELTLSDLIGILRQALI